MAIVAEIVGQSDSNVKEETARGMNVVALYSKNYPFFPHTVAVKQCYENLRRIYLEQQENRPEFSEHQSQRRKYRSRRDRVSV